MAQSDSVRSTDSRPRVLVADDNRDATDSLALLLHVRGCEVRTAYDGPSVLMHAAHFDPTLVLLDIGMPGMDGFEVVRHLRAIDKLKNVMVVALTGWGDERSRQRAIEAGFNRHLTKPIGYDVLQELLNLRP